MTETASDSLAYSRRHMWVQADPETHQALIGITDYLADTIGLIVSIDLPQVELPLSLGSAAEESVDCQVQSCQLTFTGLCGSCKSKMKEETS